MIWKGIVGRNFTPDAFREYVAGLTWGEWQPEFIVLHNTEDPSLAMRPDGLTEQHIRDLEKYYRDNCGWSAGPHVFVDDRQIWVFTPLDTPGVHANSWNSRSLGVEMLGDYRREPFNSGRGLAVQQNAVAVVAILSLAMVIDPGTMMLHKENGETKHDCPGDNVSKPAFIQAVKNYMGGDRNPATGGNMKQQELDRAKDRLPIFQAAADAYEWPPELEEAMKGDLGPQWMVWILAAIDSRESRFGLALDEDGLGDVGHGHGEMQIDDRSHAVFCASGRWRDIAASLEYVHKNVIVPAFNYLGDYFSLFGEDYAALFRGAIAAYNCGPGNVRQAMEAGQDVDARTTGKDYSADVIERAMALKEALG